MATNSGAEGSRPATSPMSFPMMSDIEMYRFLMADEPFWKIAKLLGYEKNGPEALPPKTDAEAAKIINAVHQGGAVKTPEYWAAINRDSYEIKRQNARKSPGKARVLSAKGGDSDEDNSDISNDGHQRYASSSQLESSSGIGYEEEQAAAQLMMISAGFVPAPKINKQTKAKKAEKEDFPRSELAITRKQHSPKKPKVKEQDKEEKPDLAVIEEVIDQFLADEYSDPRWDDIDDDKISAVIDKMSGFLLKAVGRRQFNTRWELERVVYEEHEYLMEAFGGDIPEHLTRWD
ncbi:hypothetical protein K490DRAFT_60032 [Saccharata proteae CBS 121410]|uniref:Uncharacterized protein n=1 Tax=Saccharata proteae CBS 121410 TaxID=1314787 RepID=A0A9P4HPA3_9PEZI|nr:hypothetical protein K490DRAFT_60032 [Saccharata proteae CBS 121410]